MRGRWKPTFHAAFLGGFVFIGLALSVASVTAQVILSEIMNNPTGSETSIPGGDSNEFIELFNIGSDTVDLTGWRFSDGDDYDSLVPASHSFSTLPNDSDGIFDSMLLPPGGFALILDPEYVDSSNDQPYDWPTGVLILTISATTDLGGSRLATNDPIHLYNNVNCPIDSLAEPFDPGDGISIERTEATIEAGWGACISPAGCTPGYENAIWTLKPGESAINANPNPFDPMKEQTTIELNLPAGGITVAVYDRLGRRLIVLSEPSNPKCYPFDWDGRDESGDILPAGLYILFAEDCGGNKAKSVIAIKGSR